jgi:hypothetical protein
MISGILWVVLLSPTSRQGPLVRVLWLTWGCWLWERRERCRRSRPRCGLWSPRGASTMGKIGVDVKPDLVARMDAC